MQNLSIKHTHIGTFNGRDIYTPNATMLKSQLINYTQDGLLRHYFTVGLDYGESTPKVMEVISKTLARIKEINHADELDPIVTIDEFATSTINLKIHFWINSKDFFGSTTFLKSVVMRQVLEALIAQRFGMPADILDLKMYEEGKPTSVVVKNDQFV